MYYRRVITVKVVVEASGSGSVVKIKLIPSSSFDLFMTTVLCVTVIAIILFAPNIRIEKFAIENHIPPFERAMILLIGFIWVLRQGWRNSMKQLQHESLLLMQFLRPIFETDKATEAESGVIIDPI